MKIAFVRVGVDTGAGGIHGPLFKDGSFEFIPIPDDFGLDARTYGKTLGKNGKCLVEYFPVRVRSKMQDKSMHFDPEFSTFTYGDPTPPKSGLRRLDPGDLLVFYCGLQGWDFTCDPALYIIGYFEVEAAGRANDFRKEDIRKLFRENFHVRHTELFEKQREKLVLVKGSTRSRLLNRAAVISVYGRDRRGRPIKILSPEMRQVFGSFDGRLSFQRSPTRWLTDRHLIEQAADFVRRLD